MDLSTIDEFIYLKAKNVLQEYFNYLKPGLDYAKAGKLNFDSSEEKACTTRYNRSVLLYQIKSSGFILDAFFIIELFMKSALFRKDKWLVFDSIDRYPEAVKKWEVQRTERKASIDKLINTILGSLKGKDNKTAEKCAEKLVPFLFASESEEYIVDHSIDPQTALNRLIYCLNWRLTPKVVTLFTQLYNCRNEIIHFGIFDNISNGCHEALRTLMLFSGMQIVEYPQFSKIHNEFKPFLEPYKELWELIVLRESLPQITDKLINSLKKVLPSE
jgi:hypothetical protein